MLDDGQYSVDVSLTGGSGRANITSPAKITVSDGNIKAEIEWSSPNYDYMEVDGKQYYPVNTEGNSVFEIDVTALDTDIPIKAETLAMSEPHIIDYTLHFDSSTSKSLSGGHTILITFIALCSMSVCFAAVLKRKKNNAKT